MGSNIRPQREIRAGLDRLAACFGRLTVSPAYRCAAIGFNGPPFINLVVSFTTTLGLADVVSILRRLERSRSYSRPQKIAGSKFWRHVVTTRRAVATDGTRQKKFSSRVLDLDLLLYGDHCEKRDGLELPRPDIVAYAYVLWPLADIAAHAVHPALKISYRELRKRFSDIQSVRRMAFCWRGTALPIKALAY